jgi:O-antigen/teichoic acid export membrane protein
VKTPLVKGLVRSVAVLASGTAAAQAILLLSAPLLTRLYTPEQFGVLAAYMATVTILGAVATLRYELVIPLPRLAATAFNALALTVLCVVAVSMACAVVLLLFGGPISVLIGKPELALVTWLVPIGVLSMGVYTALNNWAVRRRSFGTIARTRLTQAVLQTVVQLAAAFSPYSTLGLLFGNLLGQSAGVTSLFREFQRDCASNFRQFSWHRVWLLARYYWHFPALSLPASVAFSASQQLPAIMMFTLFGPAKAGFYLLAQRVGMMPATLLSTALSQSIYRNLADRKRRPAEIGNSVIVPVQLMSSVLIGPAVFCAAIAPLVTGAIFGPDWAEAGQYLRWIAPWVATTIVFGAMSPIVSILGLQKMGLVFQVGSLVISMGAMYIVGVLSGPVAAIAAFSITKSLSIVVYRLHMLHIVQVSPKPIALTLCLQTIGFVSAFLAISGILEWDTLATGLRLGIASILMAVSVAAYAALNMHSVSKIRAMKIGN